MSTTVPVTQPPPKQKNTPNWKNIQIPNTAKGPKNAKQLSQQPKHVNAANDTEKENHRHQQPALHPTKPNALLQREKKLAADSFL